MKLSEADRRDGQVNRALADLRDACRDFVLQVWDQAENVDPQQEIDWNHLALGFLLGRDCELPYEDNADGSPAGYTVEVHRLLDLLNHGARDAAVVAPAVIAVVGALFSAERVAGVTP